MNELITTYEYRDGVNDLTRELDKYLIGEWLPFWHTYIYEPDRETSKHFGIRFPGATRGHIEVDENMIIKDIRLYNDTCFETHHLYKKDVLEILSKYIGMKLIITPREPIEEQIADGTKIKEIETGKEYIIRTSIKTDNKWDLGIYLYQFDTPSKPCFGLYRKEFIIVE